MNSDTAFPLIRLLALDIDGTMLTNDKRLTDRCREAIRAAAAAGIEPVVITGRPYSGLPEAVEAMPEIRYAVTSNGAVTMDRATGSIQRSHLIPPQEALALLKQPVESGLLFNVFIDGVGYCSPAQYAQMRRIYEGRPIYAYVQKSRRVSEDLQGLIAAPAGVENIWIKAGSRQERDALGQQAAALGSYHIVMTDETDVEIGALHADKGEALLALAETLGIPREASMAIGDNDNDLGMLRAAGYAVAMGNALDMVKDMADFVTDSNEADGVAKVIERLLSDRDRK
ncbi:MAG: Cof-type HAD-IIB family hydrolase [Lachnospiraceae bacterium]|nr:Cof-type HAD-IIB family hydrolase [Lachnospiraceae bacterium]